MLLAWLTLWTATSVWASPIHFELREAPGRSVSLAADFLEWEMRPMLESTPGVYSLDLEEPWRLRIAYKFVVDGQWRADPSNPERAADGHGGYNSLRAAKSFREDPWLAPGTEPLREARFAIADLRRDPRELTVIEALRQDLASATIYFQDGADYLEQARVRELLARLARDPGIRPLTAVFIPPRDRMKEYARSEEYALFLATQVVPEIERRYPHTGGAPDRRLILGASLGGLISLYTAAHYPAVFGLAASQSGSIWWEDGALLADLARGAELKTPLKLFLDCGTYESADMLDYNRRGAETARHAGHTVTYREYPSTHDWLSWRNRLQEILRGFFSV